MTRLNTLLGLVLLATFVIAIQIDRGVAWRKISRAHAGQEEVIQITTPTGEVDRCPTCHRAMSPGGKAGARAPLRRHPEIKGHADITAYGCTPCHGGQGRRLDMEAHQPGLGGGRGPFLRGSAAQARCARCHVPTGLAGAPSLDRGVAQYLDAACSGCHQPGRTQEGLGPDLRRLGRRSLTELREALLSPRDGHRQSMMWSLTWRFDQKTREGRAALQDLITALLAMSDDPGPFRSAWAVPDLHPGQECTTCHQEAGASATGRPHRCTYLKKSPHLRCTRCHAAGRTTKRGARCPQIKAALPQCPICHLRVR